MVQIVSPQKPMEAACHKCKAGLSFVYTEIQEKITSDYGGGRDIVKYVLSGLGFSSTQRNELVVKVSGSFNRTLKIKF